MTFITRIFNFGINRESLNLQTSTCAVYKAYCNSLGASTFIFTRQQIRRLLFYISRACFPDTENKEIFV